MPKKMEYESLKKGLDSGTIYEEEDEIPLKDILTLQEEAQSEKLHIEHFAL